jgi:hypothetical protein
MGAVTRVYAVAMTKRYHSQGECTLDFLSEHIEPNFESQLVQHHAIETA